MKCIILNKRIIRLLVAFFAFAYISVPLTVTYCEADWNSALSVLAVKDPVLCNGSADNIITRMNMLLNNKGCHLGSKTIENKTLIYQWSVSYYGDATTSRNTGVMVADNVTFKTDDRDSVVYQITVTEYHDTQNYQASNVVTSALMAVGMNATGAKELFDSCMAALKSATFSQTLTLPYKTAYKLYSNEIGKNIVLELFVDKDVDKKFTITALPSEKSNNHGIVLR